MHCVRSWKINIMQDHASAKGKMKLSPSGLLDKLTYVRSSAMRGSYLGRNTLVVKMAALLTLYCDKQNDKIIETAFQNLSVFN